MFNRFFQHTRKPAGIAGRLMLRMMNRGHAPLSEWGLGHLSLSPGARILDVGCGGGANIMKLLQMCPRGFVDGIDYSEESVRMSRKLNAGTLGKRCAIVRGDVGALPYEGGTFDAVTAFETVYFWPDLSRAFAEILRVLKPGGRFLLVCEMDDPSDTTWTGRIRGMTIYAGEDLKGRLEEAGFKGVALDRKGRSICLTAIAP